MIRNFREKREKKRSPEKYGKKVTTWSKDRSPWLKLSSEWRDGAKIYKLKNIGNNILNLKFQCKKLVMCIVTQNQ